MNESFPAHESLIGELAWTRRLASRLVSDAGLADDLVQDAWMQYLTRPPRTAGSLRGWFTTVLRNLARQQGRRRRRRAEVEERRVVAEDSPATVELVARAQAQRTLVAEVLALDATERDVVLLRFFEGLDSPAVAERLGIPASTARTRLQRGLAQLRGRLERRHGRDARDWLAGLLPLLPRPEDLAARSATGAAGVASSLPAGMVWLAAAGVVLVGAAFLSTRAERAAIPAAPLPGSQVTERVRALGPGTDLAADIERSAGRPGLTARRAEARPSEGPALDPDAAAEGTGERAQALEVRVTIDGTPARRGTVHLSPEGRRIVLDPPHEATETLVRPLDARGVAVFDPVEVRTGRIGLVPRPGAPVLERFFHHRGDGPVLLELGTARIDGRVWDAEGRPAAGVEVDLGMRIGHDWGALGATCRSDPAGRFTFEMLPAAEFWVRADAPGRVGEVRAHGTLEPGELRTLQLGRPEGRVRLSGHLVDARGEVVVPSVHPSNRISFLGVDDDAARTVVPAQLAPDGGYAVELARGTYRVRHHPFGDSSTQLVLERLEVLEEGELDLALEGTTVHGAVTLAGRGTRFDPREDGHAMLLLARDEGDGRRTHYETAVQGDGSFVFPGVGPGTWTLSGGRLAEQRPVLVLAPGERERVVDLLLR